MAWSTDVLGSRGKGAGLMVVSQAAGARVSFGSLAQLPSQACILHTYGRSSTLELRMTKLINYWDYFLAPINDGPRIIKGPSLQVKYGVVPEGQAWAPVWLQRHALYKPRAGAPFPPLDAPRLPGPFDPLSPRAAASALACDRNTQQERDPSDWRFSHPTRHHGARHQTARSPEDCCLVGR